MLGKKKFLLSDFIILASVGTIKNPISTGISGIPYCMSSKPNVYLKFGEISDSPGRLNAKRKPNQESLFEQIAENPWAQRGAVLAVAGLGASSYLKNTAGAAESQSQIDRLKGINPNAPGIKAHQDSMDGAKSTAMLSLGVTVGSLAYGYFTGVFSEE